MDKRGKNKKLVLKTKGFYFACFNDFALDSDFQYIRGLYRMVQM